VGDAALSHIGTKLSPQELKKALVAAGLEVYRTLGEEVILADRVRDNLIMDSGVRVRGGGTFEVQLVLRVRKGEFPNDDDAVLFGRVRAAAAGATERGFAEREARTQAVTDPANPARTLDTFYEIVFAKTEPGLEPLLETARFALALARQAEPDR
jgi:hypothetical protein